MADAAIAATQTHEVYFVTVQPAVTFYSGSGRETLLQLIASCAAIRVVSIPVGRDFEFGTPEYRANVYSGLLQQVPAGTPIILADDYAVWAGAAACHSAFPLVGVLHADEQVYYDMAAKHIADVDVFACVSNRVQQKALKVLPGIKESLIPVIPCGINLPPMPATTAKETNTIKLVYVGRVSDYQKRTADLLHIANRLHERGIAFHLTIIGDGDARQSLMQSVAEGALSGLVSFPGWLSQQQVASHLAESDVLVLTSDFEGMPIAMMEALAMGCGFTGTRVSGIEDMELQPAAAQCLRVFDVGDIDAAVAAIQEVAAIPAEKRKAAARTIAETEFAMSVCLRRYHDAILNVPARHTTTVPQVAMPFAAWVQSRFLAFVRSSRMRLSR
jgi:glycosyltransferase involved in cell wall biosynthesis